MNVGGVGIKQCFALNSTWVPNSTGGYFDILNLGASILCDNTSLQNWDLQVKISLTLCFLGSSVKIKRFKRQQSRINRQSHSEGLHEHGLSRAHRISGDIVLNSLWFDAHSLNEDLCYTESGFPYTLFSFQSLYQLHLVTCMAEACFRKPLMV